MRFSRKRVVAPVAAAGLVALVMSGCAGAEPDGDITLTVTTFGQMGLEDAYVAFEEAHPGIKVKATNISSADDVRIAWQTKLAAGSGLPDVQAIEGGWMSQALAVADTFVDLRDYAGQEVFDNFPSWKVAQATAPDGRIIGFGTDIGPVGLCYNRNLFKEAGLPEDREAVAELLGGDGATWDKYFEIGSQYTAATGKPFYDQAGFIWSIMVDQQGGYYSTDGEPNVVGNASLEASWNQLAAATIAGQSADQKAWDWGKGEAFVDGSFATMICPGWMLGVVKNAVETAGGGQEVGWDFAGVVPGGKANWGGSFLAVPTQTKHPKEAAMLAEYLTNAESEAHSFSIAGVYPSNLEAQDSEVVNSPTEISTFFYDAPVGALLKQAAEGVAIVTQGPDTSIIGGQVFLPALNSIDSDKRTGPEAWDDAMKLYDQLIVNK